MNTHIEEVFVFLIDFKMLLGRRKLPSVSCIMGIETGQKPNEELETVKLFQCF